MAGIYLHIPFCKQACHYCDFHFSTSLQLKNSLLESLSKEILSRKNEIQNAKIATIYFGGGTPSILEIDELKKLIEILFVNYEVDDGVEITLEANPDDLTRKKIRELKNSGVNRLSIGVQSFFDEDLKYMNRVHNAAMSERSIKASQDAGFENISIDLIYGTPTLTNENWKNNLRKSMSFCIPHLSCYALTVEDKTPLASLIKRKKLELVDDSTIADHFMIMTEILNQHGFGQYEISNFSMPGFRSKHNSSYWEGKPYIGFGPGAHSFNGINKRRWNISNNPQYIHQINAGETYFEEETLTERDQYNEFIMTKIRLIDGIPLKEIEKNFGSEYKRYLLNRVGTWKRDTYFLHNDSINLTNGGKIISDQLAADLFIIS